MNHSHHKLPPSESADNDEDVICTNIKVMHLAFRERISYQNSRINQNRNNSIVKYINFSSNHLNNM